MHAHCINRLACDHFVSIILEYTVKNGSLPKHNDVSLLGHVSKIVSILLSILSYCPNNDTSCNYPVLAVYTEGARRYEERRVGPVNALARGLSITYTLE